MPLEPRVPSPARQPTPPIRTPIQLKRDDLERFEIHAAKIRFHVEILLQTRVGPPSKQKVTCDRSETLWAMLKRVCAGALLGVLTLALSCKNQESESYTGPPAYMHLRPR